jgi:hypothetical protein
MGKKGKAIEKTTQRVPKARPPSLLDRRIIYCGDNLEQLAKREGP